MIPSQPAPAHEFAWFFVWTRTMVAASREPMPFPVIAPLYVRVAANDVEEPTRA